MIGTDRNMRQAEVRPRTRLKVVDTDVHHYINTPADLYPYLPAIYRERLAEYGPLPIGSFYFHNGGYRGRRVDTVRHHEGGGSAVPVAQVQADLLDGCGIDIAILSGSSVYGASAMPDVDYGAALCRAFNEFTLEHWLTADSRFRYLMAITTQDATLAAQEIDRFGSHPNVVGVLMPCGAQRPFGNRAYDPIYEACVRHNLVPTLHFGYEGMGINGPPTPIGFPSYYIETRLARPSFYQTHLASLIFEGTFEKFPTLKVAMIESGFAWVPAYLWRMDSDWKGLRHQVPWVKRLPSEYVKEHVRFNTQPIDEPEHEEDLQRVIEWMDGAQTLMFGSDYPHWDFDDPAQTLTRLSPELRQRVFFDNASETFGLTEGK